MRTLICAMLAPLFLTAPLYFNLPGSTAITCMVIGAGLLAVAWRYR